MINSKYFIEKLGNLEPSPPWIPLKLSRYSLNLKEFRFSLLFLEKNLKISSEMIYFLHCVIL